MEYKGIEYRILQTTTPEIWLWSFDSPTSVPVHGNSRGNRQRAVARCDEVDAQFAYCLSKASAAIAGRRAEGRRLADEADNEEVVQPQTAPESRGAFGQRRVAGPVAT
jgi:hypothetical protein